ncbi:hypothetical protein OHS70_05540 [Streptomyces sp. NBC_00390]|uniref:hypothetical protein n=1 Tax=Streptomyces sp. NBC_00390 TaxID=2975736 RepID=UPI002E250A9E
MRVLRVLAVVVLDDGLLAERVVPARRDHGVAVAALTVVPNGTAKSWPVRPLDRRSPLSAKPAVRVPPSAGSTAVGAASSVFEPYDAWVAVVVPVSVSEGPSGVSFSPIDSRSGSSPMTDLLSS